jgi:hypothetical protein
MNSMTSCDMASAIHEPLADGHEAKEAQDQHQGARVWQGRVFHFSAQRYTFFWGTLGSVDLSVTKAAHGELKSGRA